MKPYYEHGGITIYHGDCREVLPRISGDALVTDPPFGIGWSRATREDDPAAYPELMRWLVAEAKQAVSGWCFVFQAMANVGRFHEWFPEGWRLFAACRNFTQMNRGGVCHAWEPVAFWNQAGAAVPNSPPNSGHVNRDYHVGNTAGVFGESPGHPCRRPLDTMRHIVQLAAPVSALILDPFAGSGTTLLAAQQTYRRAIGIEIEERYCEIAARRLAQEVLPLEMAA